MCEQCQQLRVDYRLAVEAYGKAARNIRGSLGDDFKAILQRVQALRSNAREAQKVLHDHWQECHAPEIQRSINP